MKKALFTLIVLLTIGITAWMAISPAQSAQPNEEPARTSGLPVTESTQDAESIRAATIQILAFPAGQSSSDAGIVEIVAERGLGTLVVEGSENLIVTHDHWNALEGFVRVQLLDASGLLLAEISGGEFRSLIHYRDDGTMLLAAPLELSPAYQALLAARAGEGTRPALPGILGDSGSLQVGQVVAVAYRAGEGRGQVAVKSARVVSITEFEGKAAVKLESLDGSVILPGDSGGGIWLDGKLVGNMWLTEWVYDWRFWTWDSLKPAIKHLDTSIAAQLPASAAASIASGSSSALDANTSSDDESLADN